MPETTQTELIQIQVEGAQAQSALDRLLEAIGKVEQAVVGMGGKFDTAMQRIVEPINRLTTSMDALNVSIAGMQKNLGNTAGLEAQQREAQQLTVDYANLRSAMAQFRVRGGTAAQERFRGPTGSQIKYARAGFVEAYMRGEYGQAGFGPGMGATHPGAGFVPPTMQQVGAQPSMAGQELRKGWKEQFSPDAVRQIEEQIAAEGELVAIVEQLSDAEEQLAASTGRAVAEQLRQRANWEQMVVAGERVAEQLRRQSTELTRRAGAASAARLRDRPEVIGQVYARAGVPVTPRLEEEDPLAIRKPGVMVGDWEKEAEQIGVLEAAIGRKIVVQKLMARGSKDVAERFEKQFQVTRSKEEILREINRTGKMTTGMEKELGLQTERTGRQAQRAGGMMRYFGRYLLRYLILWQGIQAVRGIAKGWFAAHMEMADAVADFGWRVNATTEDVARYRDKLRDVSTMVGMPVGQITSPLAGQATEAELLRAAEASKVFGGSVEDWLRTLQKGDVTLDAFAHGLRISTLATEDYAKLVGNASGIAKEFNMSTGETIGLLSALPSILRTDAEGAAELTEALAGLYEQNQLLMTLGVAPAVTVGPGGAPQRRPMAEVMAEIGRQPIAQQRQLAVAIGLTGEKQQQMFLDAVAGWPEVTQAIQGTVDATGDFDEAMAGADESMKAHVESMKTAWNSLLSTIGDTEAAKSGVGGLANYFKGLTVAIEEPLRALEFLLQVLETATPGEMLAMLAMGPTLGPKLVAGLGIVGGAEARAGMEGAAGAGGAAAAAAAGVGAEDGGPPPAYFPPMPTLRMQAGMTIGQLTAEMERVIDEVFTRPYTTASGEVIQVTKEQIDALRKNTVILDETGEAIGLLNVYAPALAVAQENLKNEVAKFSLERLKDITPEEFEQAKREILPTWEARLATVPGFEEQQELQNFFVGMDDTFMQMLGTETAISYTLQDILDVEKDQLEGMWNIPTGVTMRVPLQSLDLMRWMKGAGGAGGMPTDMMPEGGPLEAAATAQDNAAMAMQTSAGAQTQAAASMSDLALQLGAKIYGDVPVEPGVAKEAALDGGFQAGVNKRRPVAGGAGKVVPMAPTGMPTGVGALTAQIAINLVSQLFLDKKVVAEVVQTELSRQLVNTARGAGGGGAAGGLRP